MKYGRTLHYKQYFKQILSLRDKGIFFSHIKMIQAVDMAQRLRAPAAPGQNSVPSSPSEQPTTTSNSSPRDLSTGLYGYCTHQHKAHHAHNI